MYGSSYKSLSSWFYLQLYHFLRWLRTKLETAEHFIKGKYENRLSKENKHEESQSTEESYNSQHENTAFSVENEVQESVYENKRNKSDNSALAYTLEHDQATDNSMKQRLEDIVTKDALKEGSALNKVFEDTSIKDSTKEYSASNRVTEDRVAKYSSKDRSVSHTVEEDTIRKLIAEIGDKDLNQLLKFCENSEELKAAMISVTPQSLSNVLKDSLHNNGHYSPVGNVDGIVNVCINLIDICPKVFESTLLQIYGFIIGKYAVVIELLQEDESTESDKKTSKVRISVVSSEMFEEAMRSSHVETIELAYTNVFPSDCRMFIGVPIYKGGYLNRKDQL